MSTFSVKSNAYLRSFYSANRNLANRNNRTDASSSKLSAADSAALRKGIRALESFEFDIDEKDVSTTDKAKFASNLRAFIDSYNYTLESSNKSSNAYIKKAGKKMSQLTEKYSSDLKNLGITTNDKGYLQISSSSMTNCKMSSFGRVFKKDSSYLKELQSCAKQINNHVDTYI